MGPARRHGKGPDRGPFHVAVAFGSGGGDFAGVGIDDLGGGLVLLRPDRRAPPPDGLLEAVAVAVHCQDADVVGEPVEQGAGEPLRAEDVMMPPFSIGRCAAPAISGSRSVRW